MRTALQSLLIRRKAPTWLCFCCQKRISEASKRPQRLALSSHAALGGDRSNPVSAVPQLHGFGQVVELSSAQFLPDHSQSLNLIIGIWWGLKSSKVSSLPSSFARVCRLPRGYTAKGVFLRKQTSKDSLVLKVWAQKLASNYFFSHTFLVQYKMECHFLVLRRKRFILVFFCKLFGCLIIEIITHSNKRSKEIIGILACELKKKERDRKVGFLICL